MLEISHRLRAMRKRHRVCYWRAAGGAEVDCVIDMGPSAVPIEIYVVCLIDAPQRLEIVSWPFPGTICSRTRREGGV